MRLPANAVRPDLGDLPADALPDRVKEHAAARHTYRALREVRHTVIRLITTHLRKDAEVSWQGHGLDFTGVTFDGGDFTSAVFTGSTVYFEGAKFTGGNVNFAQATGDQAPLDLVRDGKVEKEITGLPSAWLVVP